MRGSAASPTCGFDFALSDQAAALPLEIILVCVRWYAAYPVRLRKLEEMMAERGVLVDHATVHRWALKMLPGLVAMRSSPKNQSSAIVETLSVWPCHGRHGEKDFRWSRNQRVATGAPTLRQLPDIRQSARYTIFSPASQFVNFMPHHVNTLHRRSSIM